MLQLEELNMSYLYQRCWSTNTKIFLHQSHYRKTNIPIVKENAQLVKGFVGL